MGAGYSMIAVAQWLVQGTRHYGRAGFARASAKWRPADLDGVDLTGTTVLVTGGNGGLGRAAAEALAARRASVHLLCRSAERGAAAAAEIAAATGHADVTPHAVDVSDPASVRAFAAAWGARPVHALINNAGVLPATRTLAPGGVEAGLATALGGTLLLTGLLLPALAAAGRPGAPARVINVSSGGGLTVRLDIDDLNGDRRAYDGTLQYAHAKRAQMALTAAWARKLAGAPVAVHAMHPGWAVTEGVKTSIPDFYEKQKDSMRTAAQGADTIVWLAASPAAAAAAPGRLWFDRAPADTDFPLAGTALGPRDVDKLWREAERLTGWTYAGSPGAAAVDAARAAAK
jgi:dehydrogenase/reductase SDR family protein 12